MRPIPKVIRAAAAWVTAATLLCPFAASSASYSNTHPTLDFGGGHATSARYSNIGSHNGIASTSGSSIYFVRHGFVGQIHDAPIVHVSPAEDLTRVSATLRGNVNPNNLPTAAQFEYGLIADYGTTVALDLEAAGGSLTEAVSAQIASLDPGTDYHYRLTASNPDGTAQSTGQILSTVINEAPILGSVTLKRRPNQTAKILIADLLAGVTDPEGDDSALDSVAAVSTNEGELFQSGGWLLYLPPEGSNADDSFTYVVKDSFGATSTGTVVVLVEIDDAPTLNIRGIDMLSETDGHVRIRFVGIPGRLYEIQATENLGQPWQTIATTTADSVGRYEFIDEDAGNYPQRFYRAAQK